MGHTQATQARTQEKIDAPALLKTLQSHTESANEERRRREAGTIDDAFADFRWQLEELRVSIFAQELKAVQPVSVQRLQKQWSSILKAKSAGN